MFQDAPRLLSRLASLPESVQIVLLAPSSADPKTKTIDDCIKIAKGQAFTLHQSRNLIDHLPAEIITEIGRYAVLSADKPSSELALRLVAVSKRWNDIFSGDVELWGHMRFDSNMSGMVKCIMDQAEVMLSRGPPRVLWIDGDDDYDLGGVYDIFRATGSTLRELRASLAEDFGLDRVWDTLGPSAPLLRSLHINSILSNPQASPIVLPLSCLPVTPTSPSTTSDGNDHQHRSSPSFGSCPLSLISSSRDAKISALARQRLKTSSPT